VTWLPAGCAGPWLSWLGCISSFLLLLLLLLLLLFLYSLIFRRVSCRGSRKNDG
jgi:hypothetical protein